jgi:uroporphyrinogen-III synthase
VVELIAKHGGEPMHAPALAESPDLDPGFIAKLIAELETRPAKLAIFQTGVGTQALFKAADALGLTEKLLAQLARLTVLARGPKPLVALMEALDTGRGDAVAVTNATQVYNLFELAERLGRAERLRDGLNRTLIASVGPVSSEALQKFGVNVGVEASPPKLRPLIAALEAALNR